MADYQWEIRKRLDNISINLSEPGNHFKQAALVNSLAKRRIAKAGRRGGKTKAASIIAGRGFKAGRRVLYAVPVGDQLQRFWSETTRMFAKAVDQGLVYKNETEHIIELIGTEVRIKAKTAWNADTLRGDFADILILDEWQLMNEDAWEFVGAPMLVDNNGDAVFLFTQRLPEFQSRTRRVTTKAKDPLHAVKMLEMAKADRSGRWAAFEWTSHENPHISKEGLESVIRDMSSLAYRIEIMGEDIRDAPGALWKRDEIDRFRVVKAPPLSRIVVGVDPSATSSGDEAGIITAGSEDEEGYILSDDSVQGSPLAWGKAAVTAYHKFSADRVVAESNNGGEMVELTIKQIDPNVPVKLVHASRGKYTRAEPISALAEKGKIHHVGRFDALENELCMWAPGDASPNRLDAAVWALTELMLETTPGLVVIRGRKR